MKRIVFLFLALIFLTSSQTPKHQILIIGDSISIGYTPFVKEALKDVAIVEYNAGNAQFTGTGLEKLDEWIGDEHWDIIQFNWGLWDLCYRSLESKTSGNRDKINGVITTSLKEYRENLVLLVQRLQKTKARLVFVTTSFVPENEVGRFAGDENKYNEVALKVMKEYGIRVNNIHRLSKKIHAKYGEAKDNVHYKPKGYELLSEQIARVLKNESRKVKDDHAYRQ
jgi:lysophospholipase L1-like esterase